MCALPIWTNCTARTYRVNKERMVRLAQHSRDELNILREATGISYDERARGTLQLFRKQSQLDGVGADIDVLRDHGLPFELLDRDGCIHAEPGLAHSAAPNAGGLRLPLAETGHRFQFTTALAHLAAARARQSGGSGKDV